MLGGGHYPAGMPNPFTRENLGHQLREFLNLGWFNLLFLPLVVVPAVAAGSLFWRGIDAWRAQGAGGVAGTASIVDCQPAGRRQSGWQCDGEFTSDDGTIHIARLQLFPVFDERPYGDVEARVSGPDATIAVTPTRWTWLVPIVGGVALAGLAGYLLYEIYLEPPSPRPRRSARVKRRPPR